MIHCSTRMRGSIVPCIARCAVGRTQLVGQPRECGSKREHEGASPRGDAGSYRRRDALHVELMKLHIPRKQDVMPLVSF